jgi:beta-galactosidase beta subunit
VILVDIGISMIIDLLHHAGRYSHLSARFDAGFAFLKGLDFGALKPGRNDIDGRLTTWVGERARSEKRSAPDGRQLVKIARGQSVG